MMARRQFFILRQRARMVLQTACLGLMASSVAVQPLAAAGVAPAKSKLSSAADQKKWREPLSKEEEINHLLNRITFGPRPGDMERVHKMGLSAFLDEQLHPERIDDSAIEARVEALPSLSMTSEELAENYPAPQQAAKLADRKGREGALQPANAVSGSTAMTQKAPPQAQMAMEPQGPQGPQRVIMELAQEEVLRAACSNRQLQEVMVQFWMNHFNIFAPKGADRWLMTSFERDTIRPRAMGKFEDLLVATAESPAMLFYLDNWLSATPNPTYVGNGKAAPVTARNQYGVWRRFGGFGGLGRLGSGPFGNPQAPRGQPRPAQAGQARNPQGANRRGLNENYAREVMELHTLGVNGGYTQKDVIEVARCLTGWTIDRPQKGGEFVFRPGMHDFGEKLVLGHKIKAGRGMEDGLEVLHLLAHQPATAQFVSLKLCRRFVADDPPQSLVDRAAKTFLKTDGDIRQVLKTILTSKEFYSQAAYRAKVKSPLELVVSSVRALGGQTDVRVPLIQMIARMGQPMFQYQAPTGFPDRASTWINSGSLLVRINFASAFATNRIPGTQIDLSQFVAADPAAPQDAIVQELAARLVGGELTPQTRDAILASLSQPGNTSVSGAPYPPLRDGAQPAREAAMVAGLLLASPEFQRR